MNGKPGDEEIAAVVAALGAIAKQSEPAAMTQPSGWRKAARLESVSRFDDE